MNSPAAHWPKKRLRFLTAIPQKGEIGGVPDETEVSFVPMEAIGENGQIETSRTKAIAEVRNGYSYFAEGDVVLAKITPCFENGKGAIATHLVNEVGFGTTELHVIRAGPGLDTRFLFYVTKSHPFRKLGEAEMYGAGGQKRIPESFVRDFRVHVPGLDEQRTIADFLDRETARVGDLIAKKQRLIVLLQNQQEGLVRQIVTGQDVSVPKRYSGYAWLGDVPSHWNVLPLKRIAKRVVVGIAEASTHAYSDDGIPLIRSANIKPNKLDAQQLLKIEPWFANKNKSKTVLGGDLLTVRSGVNYGDTAVVPTSLAGSQCFTLLVTSLKLGNVPRYFSYYLNSGINRDYFGQEAWGAAQANLSVPILQMTPVPVPPPSEQARIVHELDRRLKDIECLRVSLEETERQLRLLRSALISAAVTGQIDVRNYRPQEAAVLCQ